MPTTTGRLLTLLSLLQARRDWPGGVLAERLAVSPRTVRRDVDRLRDLGYPIAAVKGPDGGYRLAQGTELPPLLFDDDQAVALTVALQVATTGGAGVEEAAARALVTLRQVLPTRLRRRVDAVQVVPVGRVSAGVDTAVLTAVGTAVRAAEVLRFDYATPGRDGDGDGDGPPRRVEPHGVAARSGRFYLVAYDLDRDDWRTFRLDRMHLRTPTGPRFRPRDLPGGDLATFVAGRFRGTDGTSTDWPCRGEVVVDRPIAAVAPYVDDGAATAVDDARCRVALGAWSWPALAARFAALDGELEVVGPRELQAAFATLAGRFARTARGPGTSG